MHDKSDGEGDEESKKGGLVVVRNGNAHNNIDIVSCSNASESDIFASENQSSDRSEGERDADGQNMLNAREFDDINRSIDKNGLLDAARPDPNEHAEAARPDLPVEEERKESEEEDEFADAWND
mmetsp:Transcript_44446/g.58964  ORF Transcript_44446/g.58964 Transcript_44446/m.58964 type:complete len:124 (-) Transcript_44446:302-673(-)